MACEDGHGELRDRAGEGGELQQETEDAIQLSWRWVTRLQASAMRPWPRLVASARTPVKTTREASAARPLYRWLKARLNPVQRSTSLGSSVMRMGGKRP